MWEKLKRRADGPGEGRRGIWPALGADRLRDLWHRFVSDRQGVAAVFFVLALVPITAAAGAAIDISRAYLVKARLGSAIDAAGLAVGSSVGKTEAELNQILNAYFTANYPAEELGVPATPMMTIQDSVIKISATASVDTTLMRVVQIDHISVEASTEIIRETKGLDVVLVLDNTGSMAGSKISSLKSAAKQFINILFGDDTEPDLLLVGIVPFTGSVNVGTDPSFTSTFINSSPAEADFSPDHWRGCVEARTAPNDQNDTDQNVGGKWTKYLWPHNGYRNDWTRLYANLSNWPYYGPNKQCPVEIQPLTNRKVDLVNKIDSMVANGVTHINFGAVWGWRVLSPGVPYTEGHEYNDPDFNKAIVIMTDGENYIGSSGNYSAYGDVSEGRLGTTSTYYAVQELDDRLTSVCTRIKEKGVLVYTITFQVNSSSTRALMRSCATDPNKYFNSPNNEELERTFRAIGAELSNLRIGR